MEKDGIWLSKEDYEEMVNQINEFSNTQRMSSIILWIGLIMIVLHIAADLVFHF